MLINFIGAKGCGKSTASEYLTHRGFERVSMAGGLKSMLAAIGLTEAQLYGDEKEIPLELLCGQTPRHAMQTLGTEWGRELIGGDIWVNAAKHRIAQLLDHGVPVVTDDVRFHNEADAVRELGGLIVRLRRPEAEAVTDGHASEAFWRELPYDIEIHNDSSVVALYAEIQHALNTQEHSP